MTARTRGWLAVFIVLAASSRSAIGCGSRDDVAGTVNLSPSPSPGVSLGEAGASACALHCSSDLHSILDCEGQLVQACPAGQGCGGSTCVAACDSARINKSTIGCDYYAAPIPTSVGAGGCYAAFVANTWTTDVTIDVELGGQALSAATMAQIPSGTGPSITYAPLPGGVLPPGQIAILFLDHFGVPPDKPLTPSCPPGITPGITDRDPALHSTGMGTAFHISTTAPVVAYDIFPYGGGKSAITSASLLLPTTAWDVNYLAVNAHAYNAIDEQGVKDGNPFLTIVAAEDDTVVTLLPKAAVLPGPGVAGGGPGVPQQYSLGRGQTLTVAQKEELTGSPIEANKPIGLFGGNQCMQVPVGTIACDAAHQQIPPVKALGHEYVAVRYRNRFDGQEESPPWRVVGAVAGTTLSYDPAPPEGAPTSLDVGQTAEFSASSPFVVRSQDTEHPFYLAGYMTGCAAVGPASDCRGDPEFVNVIPAQQYLSSYVFYTDPTYPEANLVVVRSRGTGGSPDVTLDCAGAITGFQPIGSSSYEYARIDLSRHDFTGQNGCDNGRHEIRSTGPFGLTVWGWGSAETGGNADPAAQAPGFFSQFVSYAYPAGASVQPINTVVIPSSVK